GCDMFLMPSQFEPCGLSQLIAQRDGTIPIVRETGGLRDTVLSYNEYTGDGNGFSFFNYNAHDMLHVIERACDYYHNHKDVWALLQQRGMSGDYSWTNSAGKYMDLYKGLVAGVEEVVEAPAEPNPVVVEIVEEAPKPKKPRAPRKKKVEEPAAEVTEAPAKPKRTRKKAEAAPVEAAEAPSEKPKRTRKKAEAAPAEATEAPAKPKRTRKKASEEPKAE
ncbi:MAG: glycogen synthase GlgA, partial [Clostridia bacterium]|nr:glycogen synthase GlgA [Clostridia bacterium]